MDDSKTINWHDYKPGDVQTKLHRLFRHSEEVDNMSVRIGEVITFAHPKADKAQVLKIAEEEHEVFSAWEDYDELNRFEAFDELSQSDLIEARAHLVDECADLITATCNLLAALGVDDMRDAMEACERRNRERGRL